MVYKVIVVIHAKEGALTEKKMANVWNSDRRSKMNVQNFA